MSSAVMRNTYHVCLHIFPIILAETSLSTQKKIKKIITALQNRTNVEILPGLKISAHSNLPVLGSFQRGSSRRDYCYLLPAKIRRGKKKAPLPVVSYQNGDQAFLDARASWEVGTGMETKRRP